VTSELFELVEDVRLESLEDFAVRSLNLPIGTWVPNRRPVDPDPVSVGEVQELLAYDVDLVVGDDGVGDTEPIDDVKIR
jgi:hypothetical protein